MKYVDWNDVYVTGDLILNITKYFTIDPNDYFYNFNYEPIGTNNDQTSDSVQIQYTLKTDMPTEKVTVKAVLFPKSQLLHPFYPIRDEYWYRAKYKHY